MADQYTAGMDYQTIREGQPSGFIRSLGAAARGPVSVTQKRDAGADAWEADPGGGVGARRGPHR